MPHTATFGGNGPLYQRSGDADRVFVGDRHHFRAIADQRTCFLRLAEPPKDTEIADVTRLRCC